MSPCTAMNIDLDTSYRITREGLDRLENQDLKQNKKSIYFTISNNSEIVLKYNYMKKTQSTMMG